MTDMETPRDIGWRNDDRERRLLARYVRREIALGFPEAIPPLFDLRGAVPLVHLLGHEARIIRRGVVAECETPHLRSCFHHMWMLGIETSCDETSVAILKDDGTVSSNLIASQIARHQPFGGVVPEIASREHLQHLMPLLEKALAEAGVTLDDLGGISVTAGPGLIGALLVGVAAAQGLSYGKDIPLVPVNHLAGHAFSGYLRSRGPALPLPDRFLSLVVSGGHSSIY